MIEKVKGMFKTVVPKREAYEKQIAELETKKARKTAYAALLKAGAPQKSNLYNSVMKEIALLNLKIDDVVDEYNRFVAKENAIQKAFERLNGLNQ